MMATACPPAKSAVFASENEVGTALSLLFVAPAGLSTRALVATAAEKEGRGREFLRVDRGYSYAVRAIQFRSRVLQDWLVTRTPSDAFR